MGRHSKKQPTAKEIADAVKKLPPGKSGETADADFEADLKATEKTYGIKLPRPEK